MYSTIRSLTSSSPAWSASSTSRAFCGSSRSSERSLHGLADALAHLELGEPLTLELQRELEALGDVEQLQQLQLLLVGEVRRIAGRIGERTWLGDAADECRDAAVVATQLEDLLDYRS